MSDFGLLTLQQAASRIGAGVTVHSLRTEIKRGRLQVVQIGGKTLVEESEIRGMIERCRGQANHRDCGSESQADRPDGSSSTEATNIAQAAALESVKRLRERSRGTSQPNTNPPAGKRH